MEPAENQLKSKQDTENKVSNEVDIETEIRELNLDQLDSKRELFEDKWLSEADSLTLPVLPLTQVKAKQSETLGSPRKRGNSETSSFTDRKFKNKQKKVHPEDSAPQQHSIGWRNFSYNGGWLNNMPEGYGEFKAPGQDLFKGQWKDGVFKGSDQDNCVKFWADGKIYIGQMQNKLPHGKGILIWLYRRSHKGYWSQGIPNGAGVLSIFDHQFQDQAFKDNVPGFEKSEHHFKLSGEWENGHHPGVEKLLIPQRTHLEKALRNHQISDNIYIPFNTPHQFCQTLPLKINGQDAIVMVKSTSDRYLKNMNNCSNTDEKNYWLCSHTDPRERKPAIQGSLEETCCVCSQTLRLQVIYRCPNKNCKERVVCHQCYDSCVQKCEIFDKTSLSFQYRKFEPFKEKYQSTSDVIQKQVTELLKSKPMQTQSQRTYSQRPDLIINQYQSKQNCANFFQHFKRTS